jgi:hypothetical protein
MHAGQSNMHEIGLQRSRMFIDLLKITACPAGQCSVNGDIVFLWEGVNFDQL